MQIQKRFCIFFWRTLQTNQPSHLFRRWNSILLVQFVLVSKNDIENLNLKFDKIPTYFFSITRITQSVVVDSTFVSTLQRSIKQNTPKICIFSIYPIYLSNFSRVFDDDPISLYIFILWRMDGLIYYFIIFVRMLGMKIQWKFKNWIKKTRPRPSHSLAPLWDAGFILPNHRPSTFFQPREM